MQRNSTIDVQLDSKYTSAYIYIQLSPIEIICILNIFVVREEWNRNFPAKSVFRISLFMFPLHDSFSVTL